MIVYVVRDAAGNVRRVTSQYPDVSPVETYEAFEVDGPEHFWCCSATEHDRSCPDWTPPL